MQVRGVEVVNEATAIERQLTAVYSIEMQSVTRFIR